MPTYAAGIVERFARNKEYEMEDLFIVYQYGIDFHPAFDEACAIEEEHLYQESGLFTVDTTFMYIGL